MKKILIILALLASTPVFASTLVSRNGDIACINRGGIVSVYDHPESDVVVGYIQPSQVVYILTQEGRWIFVMETIAASDENDRKYVKMVNKGWVWSPKLDCAIQHG